MRINPDLAKAIRYTLKYSTKPQDLLGITSEDYAHSVSRIESDGYDDANSDSNHAHTSVEKVELSSNALWLVELTRQLHNTRAIALGGIFKDYIRDDEPEDLLNLEGEPVEDCIDQNAGAVYFWNEDDYRLMESTE